MQRNASAQLLHKCLEYVLGHVGGEGVSHMDRRSPRILLRGKDGWDFTADDPIQLLGLVAVFEHENPEKYEEYWWRKKEPWLLEDLPQESPDYVPIPKSQIL